MCVCVCVCARAGVCVWVCSWKLGGDALLLHVVFLHLAGDGGCVGELRPTKLSPTL